MSDDVRPIVIKRIKKVAGGHHGGAWKIAYADFVTAIRVGYVALRWPYASWCGFQRCWKLKPGRFDCPAGEFAR